MGQPLPCPKLHPGPCSSVGVRPRTDRHTHRQTNRCTRPQYILHRLRVTQNVKILRVMPDILVNTGDNSISMWANNNNCTTTAYHKWIEDERIMTTDYNNEREKSSTTIVLYKLVTTPPPQPFYGPYFRDRPGETVPEENFWILWCKWRLTEADTPAIRQGATPSGLTSAHLHHPPFFTGWMSFLPPNQQCQSSEGN